MFDTKFNYINWFLYLNKLYKNWWKLESYYCFFQMRIFDCFLTDNFHIIIYSICLNFGLNSILFGNRNTYTKIYIVL